MSYGGRPSWGLLGACFLFFGVGPNLSFLSLFNFFLFFTIETLLFSNGRREKFLPVKLKSVIASVKPGSLRCVAHTANATTSIALCCVGTVALSRRKNCCLQTPVNLGCAQFFIFEERQCEEDATSRARPCGHQVLHVDQLHIYIHINTLYI